MNSVSAINSGLQGIQKGLDGIKKNAHAIATANGSEATVNNAAAGTGAEQATAPKDVTEPLVYMKINQLQTQASAKVVQTSSDMIGSLIDMKA